MRVGVIGTGFGRRVVAPVFAETPGCDVADVVSPRDADAVAALCRRDDVDLVSVHSPPFLHATHVREALGAGRHVLCDKPFAMSATEAEALLREAEAAGVVHLLNFEFRQHPARRRLRDLLHGGAVGAVEHVSYVHVSSGSRVPLRRFGWLFDRSKGGGWIGAWGSHAVDFIRWTFGEIADAGGVLRTEVRERPDGEGRMHTCDAEDGFTAWLALATGATVTIDTTFAGAVNMAPRVTVLGSDGAIEWVAEARITIRGPDGRKEEIDLPPPSERDPHLEPMRRWAEIVRDAVHEARRIEPSFADGAACDRVLDKLRAGTRT